MKGIHAAIQGRLGADVDLRRSQSGKDWCRLSVGVGAVFEEKARALAGLAKDADVYVEGRLWLNTWNGKDGAQRTGLAVTAWEVVPLGQIGRKRPSARRPADAVSFNDPLPF